MGRGVAWAGQRAVNRGPITAARKRLVNQPLPSALRSSLLLAPCTIHYPPPAPATRHAPPATHHPRPEGQVGEEDVASTRKMESPQPPHRAGQGRSWPKFYNFCKGLGLQRNPRKMSYTPQPPRSYCRVRGEVVSCIRPTSLPRALGTGCSLTIDN